MVRLKSSTSTQFGCVNEIGTEEDVNEVNFCVESIVKQNSIK
jgi:hypothetical protein